jgi:hypothetical protein
MKEWLIRTKNNHILGPVTREKVLDLYNNGSIKQEDEICTGNGYWFFVREKDLVDKYLLGNTNQDFNPVQEAEPVLTKKAEPAAPVAEPSGSVDEPVEMKEEDLEFPDIDSGDAIPDDSDLEYPDLSLAGGDFDDLEPSNVVNLEASNPKINLDELNAKENQQPIAPAEPQDDPLTSEEKEHFDSLKPKQKNIDLAPPIHPEDMNKKLDELAPPTIPPTVNKKNFFTVNILIFLVFMFLVLFGAALYFRTSIIDAVRSISYNGILIENAVAQDDSLIQKKNY